MAEYVGPDVQLLEQAKHLWGVQGTFQLLRCNENWVYHLEGTQLIFRFTADYHRSRLELEAEMEWIDYLWTHHCQVVLPVVSSAGERVHALSAGWCVSVFQKAQGEILTEETQFTKDVFKSWGRCIGEMHRHTREYIPGRSLRPQWDADDGFRLAMTMIDKIGPEHPMVKTYTNLLSRLRELPKTPQNFGLIHADIHHGNFFVDNSGKFVVFDFDDCCYHWLLFDLAVPMATMELMYLRGQAKTSLRRFQDNLLAGYAQEYPLPENVEEVLELLVQYRIAHVYLWAAARVDAGRTKDVPAFEKWMKSCEAYFKKSP